MISSISSNMFQMNSATMQQRRDDMFSKIDSNGNGSLDKTEFSALAKKMSEMSGQSINADNAFSTYDTNGDGSLSKSELDSFMKANAPQPPQDMSGMGGGLGQTSSNSMKQALDNLFSNIDSDTSGGIDKKEFTAFASNLSEMSGQSINANSAFSTYDTNGDGSLSKTELDSFMKANAPQPPAQMQNAMSAYGSNSSTSQVSSLSDLLKSISADSSENSSDSKNSLSGYLSKLIDSLNSESNGTETYSLLNITA